MTDLTVNDEVWSDATDDEKVDIKVILIASGLLKVGDEIIPDPDTPAVFADDEAADAVEGKFQTATLSPCKAACKVARDGARAACGVKYPFSSRKRRQCREAVERAHDGCRAVCDLAGG